MKLLLLVLALVHSPWCFADAVEEEEASNESGFSMQGNPKAGGLLGLPLEDSMNFLEKHQKETLEDPRFSEKKETQESSSKALLEEPDGDLDSNADLNTESLADGGNEEELSDFLAESSLEMAPEKDDFLGTLNGDADTSTSVEELF